LQPLAAPLKGLEARSVGLEPNKKQFAGLLPVLVAKFRTYR